MCNKTGALNYSFWRPMDFSAWYHLLLDQFRPSVHRPSVCPPGTSWSTAKTVRDRPIVPSFQLGTVTLAAVRLVSRAACLSVRPRYK